MVELGGPMESIHLFLISIRLDLDRLIDNMLD